MAINRPLTTAMTMSSPGEDPGFLERGFICIKVWGFALPVLSNFS